MSTRDDLLKAIRSGRLAAVQLALDTGATLEIADGSCDVAIVCGGEAYRTRQALRRDGNRRPDWTQQTEADEPTWGDAQRLDMGHPAEVALGILMPTQCYPLF